MKTIITETFQCDCCGAIYPTAPLAVKCEATPFETTTFKAGDFLGAGDHGWWNADTSWTLSQPAAAGKGLDAMEVPDTGWRKSPPGPFAPVKRVVLPVWRIIAIKQEAERHNLRFLLWCPRHANRVRETTPGCGYGEAVNWTAASGHRRLLAIPTALCPMLTAKESARWIELLAAPPWDNAPLI